ncbi:MAG: hypothetical protein H5T90_07340 [Acetomicrobium sp.]|nr:hypothetical protein [Acetomicrobium sp.]
MAYPTAGGSSAALKGCATRKKVVRGVLGQPPRALPFAAKASESRGSEGPWKGPRPGRKCRL